MKIYKYILVTLSACIITAISFFLVSNKLDSDAKKQKVEVLSFTDSVSIPEYVEFCGKKIYLDRIDMHERYDREINAFTYLHSTTMLLIKRANRYFPIIEPILKEYNIPDDFKYLAVIESNLSPRALSTAKAAGLWQFMPQTGKDYGLEVNNQIDERYHIEKATVAACKYLNDAYLKYGDWVTVAASYNAGTGRISSELSNQMVNTSLDLLLVEETSRYVFRILAAKELFTNPYKYGFVLKKEDLYPIVRTKKVEVTSTIPNLAAFAQKHNINYFQLKEFNVWLRDNSLTIPANSSKKYIIDIPVVEDLYYSSNKIRVHNRDWIVE